MCLFSVWTSLQQTFNICRFISCRTVPHVLKIINTKIRVRMSSQIDWNCSYYGKLFDFFKGKLKLKTNDKQKKSIVKWC